MSPKWRGMELPKRLILDEESSSATYGKFVGEPLEKGYGITLGNSLRRVLLFSTQGAAITSVKIDGVLHEFSHIPEVVEDTSEIILNLEQIIIRLHTDQPKMVTLKAEGAGEVRARDIEKDEDVEILNPNLHIATLQKGAKLGMEMEVRKGRGYAPAERNKREGQPIGMIPLDSFFSPVRKVNYRIGDARVGERTDYNRLILEIWTNGVISPKDALSEGAEILRKHLSLFTSLEEEVEEEVEELSEEERKRREYLKMSVSELELSVRSTHCLKKARIQTIGELVKKTEADMLKYRNFGKKSLKEIKTCLSEMDLSLGMELSAEGGSASGGNLLPA